MGSDLHALFRARVRELAKARGYSINRLADFAGISGGFLSTVLRGEKSPTLRTIMKIADALNVDPIELFKGRP
jgi:transcriptional regulator with XRE-family HTH domain